MGLFKTDFTKCPMYAKNANNTKSLRESSELVKKNSGRLAELEVDVSNIASNMDKLVLEHSISMQSYMSAKDDAKEMKDAFESYMEDQASNHIEASKAITDTNTSMGTLADTVGDLLNIQAQHRQARELKEAEELAKSEAWKSFWINKVAAPAASALILGFGYFMWESMAYFAEAKIAQKQQAKMLGYSEENDATTVK